MRREMEIKANSAKFRMQSNPTDWEQDTLRSFRTFFPFFPLFFPFFSRREQYSSSFLFFHIFNTVDIYTTRIHLVPDLLVYDDEFRGRLTFFENHVSYLPINLLSYTSFSSFLSSFVFFPFCFLNIIIFFFFKINSANSRIIRISTIY